MSLHRILPLAVLASVFAVGCGSGNMPDENLGKSAFAVSTSPMPAEGSGQSSSAIVDGREDTDNRFVGFTAHMTGGCTAILISRRWMLTATHCFTGPANANPPAENRDISFNFGKDWKNPDPNDPYHLTLAHTFKRSGAVKLFRRLENGSDYSTSPDFVGHDLALVRLDELAPEPLKPIHPAGIGSTSKCADSIAANYVGYGPVTRDLAGGGAYSCKEVDKPNLQTQSLLRWQYAEGWKRNNSSNGQVASFVRDWSVDDYLGTLPGDSGGPMLSADNDRLCGVTSGMRCESHGIFRHSTIAAYFGAVDSPEASAWLKDHIWNAVREELDGDCSNPNQPDRDHDGHPDWCDVCPDVSNTHQIDTDHDGRGDDCDNCPLVQNARQEDSNLLAEQTLYGMDGSAPLNADVPAVLDWQSKFKGDACDSTPTAKITTSTIHTNTFVDCPILDCVGGVGCTTLPGGHCEIRYEDANFQYEPFIGADTYSEALTRSTTQGLTAPAFCVCDKTIQDEAACMYSAGCGIGDAYIPTDYDKPWKIIDIAFDKQATTRQTTHRQRSDLGVSLSTYHPILTNMPWDLPSEIPLFFKGHTVQDISSFHGVGWAHVVSYPGGVPWDLANTYKLMTPTVTRYDFDFHWTDSIDPNRTLESELQYCPQCTGPLDLTEYEQWTRLVQVDTPRVLVTNAAGTTRDVTKIYDANAISLLKQGTNGQANVAFSQDIESKNLAVVTSKKTGALLGTLSRENGSIVGHSLQSMYTLAVRPNGKPVLTVFDGTNNRTLAIFNGPSTPQLTISSLDKRIPDIRVSLDKAGDVLGIVPLNDSQQFIIVDAMGGKFRLSRVKLTATGADWIPIFSSEGRSAPKSVKVSHGDHAATISFDWGPSTLFIALVDDVVGGVKKLSGRAKGTPLFVRGGWAVPMRRKNASSGLELMRVELNELEPFNTLKEWMKN